MVERNVKSSSVHEEQWLRSYYFVRAAFSAIWVALAFSIGKQGTASVAVLLVIYPAWDALANFIDMSRSGGTDKNRTQAINIAVSAVTTVAVLLALSIGMPAVLVIFGVWAILSGLLQLATAVRRWKDLGAQWAMILSGAQSALAGAFFIIQSGASTPPAIFKIAGYAAVGAVYFLISAVWLHVRHARSNAA
ncbi:DUF308 domain-containing protein [Paraburkholderia susongensis]|uniref:DUF308 domain-containing protein n=1 Tax=Paraburkholderia susongensis TaxID=1515439 RepID=A0A1X7J6F8_9BURK|nr:DUF308 domain-containing protein [Paraburkholderia susongensis]SMG23216.1 Short repeat of unknown function [Paraburkholderia susongensis]